MNVVHDAIAHTFQRGKKDLKTACSVAALARDVSLLVVHVRVRVDNSRSCSCSLICVSTCMQSLLRTLPLSTSERFLQKKKIENIEHPQGAL